MKNIFILLATALIFSLSCKNNPSESTEKTDSNIETISMEVKIEGMTCTGCEQTIENAVKQLAGVESIKASHENGNAIIQVEPTKMDTTLIKRAIDESGYKTLAFITSGNE